jgi:hypothetical protein
MNVIGKSKRVEESSTQVLVKLNGFSMTLATDQELLTELSCSNLSVATTIKPNGSLQVQV